jgi:hypothetical protein
MADETPVDKDKFDALLSKLIRSKPTSLEEVKAIPKLRKDGQIKRGKTPKTKPAKD